MRRIAWDLGSFIAFALLWVVFPRQTARFYQWFGHRVGADERRLAAITPNAVRNSGALFAALVIIIWMLGAR